MYKSFWYLSVFQAVQAIKHPGAVFTARAISFQFDAATGFLEMLLPSGRRLTYPSARLLEYEHRGRQIERPEPPSVETSAGPNGPEPAPASVASVPFMITMAMKAQLRAIGCSDDEIADMTPAEAHVMCRGMPSPPTPADPAIAPSPAAPPPMPAPTSSSGRGSGNGTVPPSPPPPAADGQAGIGSESATARDTYVEDHAGKPFSDIGLRMQGYDLRKTFDYTLADGTRLYQQLRYELWPVLQPTADRPRKRFWPRREVNGNWVFGAGDRRVIYRWPEIMRAGPGATVLVPEGEGKADDLAERGFLATTVVSHKWTPECITALAGRHVIILADHDDPDLPDREKSGRNLAEAARQALAPVAASIRVVPYRHLWERLPEEARRDPIKPTEDISDWLKTRGGDPARLIDICREVPADRIITAEPFRFRAEADIPPWRWLYGRFLLRGEVAGSAAMGGTGKSTLALVEALAMNSGRKLLHEDVPAPLRVVLINLEDTRNTMEKRIAALMRHFGLTPADISDRLIILGKGEVKVKVARQKRSGDVERNETVIKALIGLMREHHADVLSIDSFIRTHKVNENDNSAIQEVVECFEDIALGADCAVHLWHHTRKPGGERVTIESARGASAFMDACRSGRVLDVMSDKEHEQLSGIQPDMQPAVFYFRAFSGKRSFAPPADQSDWFERKSVVLANGDNGAS
jgi:hypothetical protein